MAQLFENTYLILIGEIPFLPSAVSWEILQNKSLLRMD